MTIKTLSMIRATVCMYVCMYECIVYDSKIDHNR